MFTTNGAVCVLVDEVSVVCIKNLGKIGGVPLRPPDFFLIVLKIIVSCSWQCSVLFCGALLPECHYQVMWNEQENERRVDAKYI